MWFLKCVVTNGCQPKWPPPSIKPHNYCGADSEEEISTPGLSGRQGFRFPTLALLKLAAGLGVCVTQQGSGGPSKGWGEACIFNCGAGVVGPEMGHIFISLVNSFRKRWEHLARTLQLS